MREKKEAELNRKINEPTTKKTNLVVTKQEIKPPTQETSVLKKNFNEKSKETVKKETNSLAINSSSSSPSPMPQQKTEPLVKKEPETQTNGIFSFDNSPTKRYGKNNISGEDIENFVTAITKLGYDAAQLAAAARSTQIEPAEFNQVEGAKKKTRKISTDSAESEMDEEPDVEEEEDKAQRTETKNTEWTSDEETSTAESEEAMETSSDTSSLSEISSDLEDEEFERKKAQSKDSIKLDKVKNESRSKKSSSNKKPVKRKNIPKNKGVIQVQTRRCRNSSTKSLNDHENISTRSRGKASEPVQCLGPECTQAAVANSKYCSTDCGMKLAKKRLMMFLKSRVVSYAQTPTLADRVNEKELARINNEIDALRVKLAELEERHAELDGLIEKAKYRQINPSIQRERDRCLESSEVEVFCVTCGNVITEKFALKHMDKCFNKVKSLLY